MKVVFAAGGTAMRGLPRLFLFPFFKRNTLRLHKVHCSSPFSCSTIALLLLTPCAPLPLPRLLRPPNINSTPKEALTQADHAAWMFSKVKMFPV